MKFCMKKLCFIGVGLIVMTASSVFAGVLEDFEGSYTGPGSLVPDPADSSNQVLKLVSNRGVMGVDAEIFSIDTNGFTGKITMDIFDFGATTWDGSLNPPFPANGGTDHGPRWGIQGDSNSDGELDNWVAAGIMQKPFLTSNAGYSFVHDNIADDAQRAFSFNGSWFSPNFFTGSPRRVKTNPLGVQPSEGDGLQLIDTDNGGTPDAPQTPGTGAWTTWEFDIAASGEVTITSKAGTTGKFLDSPYVDTVATDYNSFGPDGTNSMRVENLQQIWVTGGQNDVNDPNTGINNLGSILGTHGVLVDNITFDGASDFSPADFDTDSDVDADDLTIWQAAYGSAAGGDTNSDSDSDGADFLTWQQEHTGAGAVATTGSVPEPSTALLLLSGALAMTGLVSRKRS